MSELELEDEDEISLLAMATTLLRNRWWLLAGMLIGAMIAVLPILWKPPLYSAKASFFPQNSDATRSGLASIAGQFGVSIAPGGNQTLSPEFYIKLLKTRVLLLPIVRDTFVVEEMGGQRVAFLDLFEIASGPLAKREEDGVAVLQSLNSVSLAKTTGVVELAVVTQWPSVSLAIATVIIRGVNEYNQKTRQGQAAAERRFVEGRLAEARDSLRAAEDRLEHFSRTNVQIGNSPSMTLERERISVDLARKQELFTALKQTYEDVRIREVRDIPLITVLESPWVATNPEPRGRLKRGLLGLMLGGFFVALFALASSVMARRPRGANPEFDEFFATVRDVRNEVLSPVRIFTRRDRRPTKSGHQTSD